MLRIERTNSTHKDFVGLVQDLDAHLTILDGDAHDFYHQFNNLDVLKNVVLAYLGDEVVGCGAFKEFTEGIIEIKRMYTHPNSRGKGVASTMVAELSQWAKELGYTACVLETGTDMKDAIGLYHKLGFEITPNYGPYAGKGLSCCFKKEL